MDTALRIVGAAIVVVTVADIFFTVLFPASRHGPVRKPLSFLVWRVFRLFGRLLHGSTRRDFLSYSGPVVIGATLVGWFLLLTAGFACLFKPELGAGVIASSGPTDRGWDSAFYFAGFNLTTLGIGDLVPKGPSARLLTIFCAALGFAYFSMSITYFLSVYSNLTGRNAFAQGLHHLTRGTGDAAVLIAELARDEDLDEAEEHLSAKADFLRQTYQSHRFYPVLRHFHYREPYYALPRILLIALDASALLQSALDKERYRALLRSRALYDLEASADALMAALSPGQDGAEPSADEEEGWRRRYRDAVGKFVRAGLRVRPDAAAGADEYVARRERWHRPLSRLADVMLYEWDAIDAAPADTDRPGAG